MCPAVSATAAAPVAPHKLAAARSCLGWRGQHCHQHRYYHHRVNRCRRCHKIAPALLADSH
eukprot:8666719-Pyramimonas_sp.AAC.1